MELTNLTIEKIVRAALEEDLGHGQDVTSNLLIPAGETAIAHINARENGVLAGLIVGLSAFGLVDAEFDITVNASDGDDIEAGQTLATIEGSARSLLLAERTALNLLSHMSGIATMTASFVNEVKDLGCEICDTRKTLPGLRTLQKYAVHTGGGANHRFGLDDAILIKDNHIQIAGGIHQALEQINLLAGHMMKIEIEVDTLSQLEEVLEHGGAHVVMLDNFSPEDLKTAIDMIGGRMTSEASGGVTLETVRTIAQSGVDYISVGRLTNSAPALDIAIDI